MSEVISEIKKRLKKWRVAEYAPEEDRAGVHTFSAERGYGRELANLIFHVALVAILVTVAAGRLVNYEGQVIVVTECPSAASGSLWRYFGARVGGVFPAW